MALVLLRPGRVVSRLGKVVMAVSIVVLLASTVGAAWWWALFGMTGPVGGAVAVSAFAALCGALFASLIPESEPRRAPRSDRNSEAES